MHFMNWTRRPRTNTVDLLYSKVYWTIDNVYYTSAFTIAGLKACRSYDWDSSLSLVGTHILLCQD